MAKLIQVQVPDIGDFHDVPVVEVFVKPGDTVSAEAPLIALESEKATMDVPSPAAGVVKEVHLELGDKVAQGSPILTLEAAEAAAAPTPPAGGAGGEGNAASASAAPNSPPVIPLPAVGIPTPPAASTSAFPGYGSYAGPVHRDCEMLVLGAGPGGYSAAFRAADLGMATILVERYATLGGVCLNVGCIPSKALLHTAAVMEEVKALAAHGIAYGDPKVDLEQLRGFKDKVVGKLTGGLAAMARARQVEVVRGVGRFLDPYHLEVDLTTGDGRASTGEKQVVRFAKAIIAAGSQAVRLPFLPHDPRIVDSTGTLELKSVPERMLVIGGGIIGLEMATVYAALGASIDVVEMQDGLMPGADRDLVRVWEKRNAGRFHKIMLNTRTAAAEAKPDGVWVRFEGVSGGNRDAPAEPQRYDLVLVAVGRAPNGAKIGAEQAGVTVNERGFIPVDSQMRSNVRHIWAIGDIVGQPMLAHKAVHEGHVAAESAAGQPAHFDARQIPSVAYTDPEVAWTGKTEAQCQAEGIAFDKAVFPWAASGRAIANGRDEGFTKLLFDRDSHRIIGGGIVGTAAGDLIGEVCLAVEMGCDATDIGKTIHPHPTLCESVGMAAEVFEGVCTDLMPARKKP